MFCSNCGKEIKDGVKFCPYCGAPNSAAEKIKAAAAETVDSTEKELGSAINEVEDSFRSTVNRDAGNGSTDNGNGSVCGSPKERLKDDRGIASYIILSIITCGIYGYYFIYRMAHDVNLACDGDGENTTGLGMFIVLSLVTCGFYAYYWYYKLGNRLADNAPRYGLSFREDGTTVLLWCLFGFLVCGIGPFIGMYILIKNSNLICGAYNRQNGL